MSKDSTKRQRMQAAWAAWDLAHGLVDEAQALGGVVTGRVSAPRVGASSPTAAGGYGAPGGGNGAPQGGYAKGVDGNNGHHGGNGAGPVSAPSGDDCLQRVRRAVADEDLARAASLDAIGERKAARAARESAFVAALAAWVDCEGAVLVADVVNGLALLLGVSPETVRRYLAVYASPFGPFAVDGDFVLRRRGR